MADTVTERIKRLIAEELDVSVPAGFAETTPLFRGGVEMDSFAVVELIALIEAHFGIEFEIEDIRPEHFTDVNSVARLVEASLKH